MEREHAKSLVTMARHAWLNGFPITADCYMRQALRCANRLKDSGAKAKIFAIRNKMRPHVAAALSPSPAGV